MSMILKSILNAYYCKEISKKIRAAHDLNMRNHQSLRVAPFGYTVNEDRTGFVIDPEPAETVREIYRLSLTGLNFVEVARVLNEKHLPTPTSYNLISNRKRTGSGVRMETSFWSNGTVRTILRDPVYTGRLTLHKYTVAVPSTRKTRKIDSEDQYIFEDAHEPIISKEDFVRVQELHPVRKSPTKSSKSHSSASRALTQHLFCGVCKRAMIPTNFKNNSYYCRTSYVAASECRKGFLSEAILEQTILSALLPMLRIFHLQVGKDSNGQAQIQKWLSECQKEIFQNQVKQQSLQRQKLELYEQYTTGNLPLLPYQQQKMALNMEIHELEGRSMKLMERESTLRDGLVPADWESISKAAERFQHADVLTREMVDAFIDRVEVYPDYIHIQWRFHDVWDNMEANPKLLSDYILTNNSAQEEGGNADE